MDYKAYYTDLLSKYNGEKSIDSLGAAINHIHQFGDPIEPPDIGKIERIAGELESEQAPEFTKGFSSGVDNLQATGYGAIGLAGSAIGSDRIRDFGYEGYQRNMQEAAVNAPRVQGFSDIGSGGDAADWVLGTLGQLAPSMLEAMASVVVGGGVGGVAGKKLLKSTVERQVAKKVAEGMTEELAKKAVLGSIVETAKKAGLVAGVGAIEAGGNFGQAADEVGVENANPWVAGGTGLVSGLTELVSPTGQLMTSLGHGAVGNAVKKLPSAMRRGLELPYEAFQEGAQEVVQQGLSDINRKYNNPDAEISGKEYVDTFAAGALGGVLPAGINVGLSLIGRAEAPPQRQEPKPLSGYQAPDLIQAAKSGINQQMADKIIKPMVNPGGLPGMNVVKSVGAGPIPGTGVVSRAIPEPTGPDYTQQGLMWQDEQNAMGQNYADSMAGYSSMNDPSYLVRVENQRRMDEQAQNDTLDRPGRGGATIQDMGLQVGANTDIDPMERRDGSEIQVEQKQIGTQDQLTDAINMLRAGTRDLGVISGELQDKYNIDAESAQAITGQAVDSLMRGENATIDKQPTSGGPDDSVYAGDSIRESGVVDDRMDKSISPQVENIRAEDGGTPKGYPELARKRETGGSKPSVIGMDPAQLQFIRNKVSQLGSVDSVDKFYPGDDKVSQYAREHARAVFQNESSYPEKDNAPKQEDINPKEQEKASYPEGVKLTSQGKPYRKRGAEVAARAYGKTTGQRTETVQLGKNDWGWRVVEDQTVDVSETPVSDTQTDLSLTDEPQEIFIKHPTKRAASGGPARAREIALLPEKEGYEKVYKPYGKDGRGYYYIKTATDQATVRPETDGAMLGDGPSQTEPPTLPKDQRTQESPGEVADSVARSPEKEPWGMTRDEFVGGEHRASIPINGKLTAKYNSVTQQYTFQYNGMNVPHEKFKPSGYDTSKLRAMTPKEIHGFAVKEALNQGKPVPKEVLADYPEFQKPGGNQTDGKPSDSTQAPIQDQEQIRVISKTTGDKKTISVDIPKKEANALKPKDQKSYLMREIDEAISKAPDKLTDDDTAMVKFEIPGDGEYNILNSKFHLENFKKMAKSFPASDIINHEIPSVYGRDDYRKSPARVKDFPGEYTRDPYKPYTKRFSILKKDLQSWGKSGEFITNGRIAIKKSVPGLKDRGGVVGDFFDTIKGQKLDPVDRMAERYSLSKENWAKQSIKGFDDNGYVIVEGGGFIQGFKPEHIDMFLTEFPDAEMFILRKVKGSTGGPIVFKQNGEFVGAVMPYNTAEKYIDDIKIHWGIKTDSAKDSISGEKQAENDGIVASNEGNGAINKEEPPKFSKALDEPTLSDKDKPVTPKPGPSDITTTENPDSPMGEQSKFIKSLMRDGKKYGIRGERSLSEILKKNLNSDEIEGLVGDGLIPSEWGSIAANSHEIGDTLDPSQTFSLGAPTGSHGSGTSSFAITPKTDIAKAIKEIDNYSDDGRVYILESEEAYKGDDNFPWLGLEESVMESPVVVGIIEPDGTMVYGKYDEELDEYIPEKYIPNPTSQPGKADNRLSTSKVPLKNPSSISELTGRNRRAFNALSKKGKLEVLTDADASKILKSSGDPKFMVAYHGSPHDFDKFTTKKMGTGEGAQAYGWGLYFSGKKDVADWYRKNISSGESAPIFEVNGESVKFGTPEYKAVDIIDGMGVKSGKAFIRNMLNDAEKGEPYTLKNGVDWYRSVNNYAAGIINKAKIKKIKGRLYKVDLAPSEDEYLLWDEPMSVQSEKVKSNIKKALKERGFDDWQVDSMFENDRDGQYIYTTVASMYGEEKTSRLLKDLGIRGIKYLDGSSRNKGEGSYNYVIFDESDVNIIAKYSKDGKVQGFFLNGKSYIIPENIESGKLWNVITHEVGVHMGQLMQDDIRFKRLLKSIENRRTEESPTGEAIRKAYDRIPKDTRPEHMAEEALAYLVENSKDIGLVKRFINLIKRMLVKLGVSESIFTQDDFAAMAEAAVMREAKTVEGKQETGYKKSMASKPESGNIPTTENPDSPMGSFEEEIINIDDIEYSHPLTHKPNSKSIKEYLEMRGRSAYDPILITEDNKVIDGAGRLSRERHLRRNKIRAIRVPLLWGDISGAADALGRSDNALRMEIAKVVYANMGYNDRAHQIVEETDYASDSQAIELLGSYLSGPTSQPGKAENNFGPAPKFSKAQNPTEDIQTIKVNKKESNYLKNREISKDTKALVKRKLRMTTNKILSGVDKFLGSSSTRLRNIHPKIEARFRKLDFDIGTHGARDVKAIEPLLRKAQNEMSQSDFKDWDYARKNSDAEKIDSLVKKYGLEKEYEAYRDVLNRIRDEANMVGLDVGFIKDYAPRVLKDAQGFLNHIGKGDDWPVIARALQDRAKKMGISIADMTPEMKADIVSNMLFGGSGYLGKPGNTKERVIQDIPPELNQYYMDSDSALMHYIYNMRKHIEIRNFSGRVPKVIAQAKSAMHQAQARLRNAVKDEREKFFDENPKAKRYQPGEESLRIKGIKETIKAYRDILDKFKNDTGNKETIAQYVLELEADGILKPEDERTLVDVLRARFSERGTHGIIQAYKNLSYLDTMGSPTSAITQIGDLAWSIYANGWYKTGKAIYKAVKNQSAITKEDVGIERIAQEFADSDTLSNAVAKVFKWVGLEKMDTIGKEALLNAAHEKYMEDAVKNPEKLKTKIEDIFGEETESVIEDLKAGKITDNVKLLVYSRLLDFQPAALSEMPEQYLKAGNGRVFYMLKTYTLKQFDVFRREVYNTFKNGDSQQKIEAVKKLAYLSGLIVLSNAGADEIKDWMLGRETTLEDRTVDNVLRLFGVSKYVTWKARTEGVGTAIGKQILPPFTFVDSLYKDIMSAGDDKGLKTISSVPIVGKLAYWHMGRGKDNQKDIWEQRFSDKRRKLNAIKDKVERKPHLKYKYRSDLIEIERLNSVQSKANMLKKRINKLKAKGKDSSVLEEKRIGLMKKAMQG